MSPSEILAEVNVRRGRLETLLKVLEVEGAVQRDSGRWLRTLQPWSYDEERVRRVTEQRRHEQRAMTEYAETDACLMEFLRRQLDDPDAAPCGRCMNCTGERPNVDVDPGLVAEAEEHLRTADLLIEPRKQWPPGFDEPRGRIPEDLRAEVGRALSVYNDGGWGRLVRRGKFETGVFDERLVEASARLILDRWRPDPFPRWVTWAPSRERPELVPPFARALADALGLPAIEAVRKIRDNRPQREMENSTQQLRNVLGTFGVETSVVEPSPVLLVDDIVDSGWTLTVIASALLEARCGPVHPFALARALGR
jgi:ATP-dependent DNA helicase RecQ